MPIFKLQMILNSVLNTQLHIQYSDTEDLAVLCKLIHGEKIDVKLIFSIWQVVKMQNISYKYLFTNSKLEIIFVNGKNYIFWLQKITCFYLRNTLFNTLQVNNLLLTMIHLKFQPYDPDICKKALRQMDLCHHFHPEYLEVFILLHIKNNVKI